MAETLTDEQTRRLTLILREWEHDNDYTLEQFAEDARAILSSGKTGERCPKCHAFIDVCRRYGCSAGETGSAPREEPQPAPPLLKFLRNAIIEVEEKNYDYVRLTVDEAVSIAEALAQAPSGETGGSRATTDHLDAARYRWLTECKQVPWGRFLYRAHEIGIDAAIDKAMGAAAAPPHTQTPETDKTEPVSRQTPPVVSEPDETTKAADDLHYFAQYTLTPGTPLQKAAERAVTLLRTAAQGQGDREA